MRLPGRRTRRAALSVAAAVATMGGLVPGASGRTLALWSFDEGAGQFAADATGQGHGGQLGSTPQADGNDPGWVPGRSGSALRFDGSLDQYVTIAGAATIAPAQITVMAWVRRLGEPGRYRYIVSNGARACDESSYGLYSGPGGGLAFYVADAYGHVLSPSAAPGAVWDGGWHQAAGTYDGSAVRLYLDGRQVGSGTPVNTTIDYTRGGAAYVGTFRGSCELPFTGDVDEASVSDAALDAAQISGTIATTGPPPPQIAPVDGPPPAGGSSAAPAPGASSSPAGGNAPAPGTGSADGGARCAGVRVSRRSVRVGRRTTVLVTVAVGGRPAARRTVTIRGHGVRVSATTARRTGRARLAVRSLRRGRLSVDVSGQPAGCRATTIAAR